jgi:hypothetical protein
VKVREHHPVRPSVNRLKLTAVNDGGLLGVVDGTGAGANSLKGLDDSHGLVIGDLAEDDVATIQPRGLDGGDEELRAVAVRVMLAQAGDCSLGWFGSPYVLGPALAMERRPGRVCFLVKFSSANFSP